jgi:hypothetical protein
LFTVYLNVVVANFQYKRHEINGKNFRFDFEGFELGCLIVEVKTSVYLKDQLLDVILSNVYERFLKRDVHSVLFPV